MKTRFSRVVRAGSLILALSACGSSSNDKQVSQSSAESPCRTFEDDREALTQDTRRVAGDLVGIYPVHHLGQVDGVDHTLVRDPDRLAAAFSSEAGLSGPPVRVRDLDGGAGRVYQLGDRTFARLFNWGSETEPVWIVRSVGPNNPTALDLSQVVTTADDSMDVYIRPDQDGELQLNVIFSDGEKANSQRKLTAGATQPITVRTNQAVASTCGFELQADFRSADGTRTIVRTIALGAKETPTGSSQTPDPSPAEVRPPAG